MSRLLYSGLFSPCPAHMGRVLGAPPQLRRSQWSRTFCDGSAAASMLHLANNKSERQTANRAWRAQSFQWESYNAKWNAQLVNQFLWSVNGYFHWIFFIYHGGVLCVRLLVCFTEIHFTQIIADFLKHLCCRTFDLHGNINCTDCPWTHRPGVLESYVKKQVICFYR